MTVLAAAFLFNPGQALLKPKPNDPVRKEILAGLRTTIERDLGQKVVFLVDQMRVLGEWSFCAVRPRQPDLKPIDFTQTRYKELIGEGLFDGESTTAVLKYDPASKHWVTKAFAIGPTDVAWMGWVDPPVSAPKAVFPPPYGKK